MRISTRPLYYSWSSECNPNIGLGSQNSRIPDSRITHLQAIGLDPKYTMAQLRLIFWHMTATDTGGLAHDANLMMVCIC